MTQIVIISTFTIGTLINRRRNTGRNRIRRDVEHSPVVVDADLDQACCSQSDSSSTASESESSSTLSVRDSPPLKPVLQAKCIEVKDKGRRHTPPNLFFDLLSRFWNKFPFLTEIWYWLLTYW